MRSVELEFCRKLRRHIRPLSSRPGCARNCVQRGERRTCAKSNTCTVAPAPYHHGPDIPFLYATALDCSWRDPPSRVQLHAYGLQDALDAFSPSTHQRCSPCPRRDYAGRDESGLHAPRRAVELLRALGREAGIPRLDRGQAQHERAEEQSDSCHCEGVGTDRRYLDDKKTQDIPTTGDTERSQTSIRRFELQFMRGLRLTDTISCTLRKNWLIR